MNFVDCKPVVDQKVTSYTNSKECSRNKKTNSRKRKAVDPHSQRGEGGIANVGKAVQMPLSSTVVHVALLETVSLAKYEMHSPRTVLYRKQKKK